MTKKADVQQLSALHKKVAETILNSLNQCRTAEHLLKKHRNNLIDLEDGDDLIEFLESVSYVSPAMLGAATKFLKDNNISCDAEEDDAMQDIKSNLAKRRNSVANVTSLFEKD